MSFTCAVVCCLYILQWGLVECMVHVQHDPGGPLSFELHDARALIGMYFNYTIPPPVLSLSAQQRLDFHYQVSEVGSSTIPRWLVHDESSNTLYGVPSIEDEGFYLIKVLCTPEHGSHVLIEDVFAIDVMIQYGREKTRNEILGVSGTETRPVHHQIQHLRENIACKKYEISARMSVVFNANLDSLNGSSRVGLLKRLSTFLSVPLEKFSTGSKHSSAFIKSQRDKIIAAGPGSLPDQDKAGVGEGLAVSWPLPCATERLMNLFPQVITRNIASGHLQYVTSLDIVGWYITMVSDGGKVNTRQRQRREVGMTIMPTPQPSQTASAIVVTSVISDIPTSSYPMESQVQSIEFTVTSAQSFNPSSFDLTKAIITSGAFDLTKTIISTSAVSPFSTFQPVTSLGTMTKSVSPFMTQSLQSSRVESSVMPTIFTSESAETTPLPSSQLTSSMFGTDQGSVTPLISHFPSSLLESSEATFLSSMDTQIIATTADFVSYSFEPTFSISPTFMDSVTASLHSRLQTTFSAFRSPNPILSTESEMVTRSFTRAVSSQSSKLTQTSSAPPMSQSVSLVEGSSYLQGTRITTATLEISSSSMLETVMSSLVDGSSNLQGTRITTATLEISSSPALETIMSSLVDGSSNLRGTRITTATLESSSSPMLETVMPSERSSISVESSRESLLLSTYASSTSLYVMPSSSPITSLSTLESLIPSHVSSSAHLSPPYQTMATASTTGSMFTQITPSSEVSITQRTLELSRSIFSSSVERLVSFTLSENLTTFSTSSYQDSTMVQTTGGLISTMQTSIDSLSTILASTPSEIVRSETVSMSSPFDTFQIYSTLLSLPLSSTNVHVQSSSIELSSNYESLLSLMTSTPLRPFLTSTGSGLVESSDALSLSTNQLSSSRSSSISTQLSSFLVSEMSSQVSLNPTESSLGGEMSSLTTGRIAQSSDIFSGFQTSFLTFLPTPPETPITTHVVVTSSRTGRYIERTTMIQTTSISLESTLSTLESVRHSSLPITMIQTPTLSLDSVPATLRSITYSSLPIPPSSSKASVKSSQIPSFISMDLSVQSTKVASPASTKLISSPVQAISTRFSSLGYTGSSIQYMISQFSSVSVQQSRRDSDMQKSSASSMLTDIVSDSPDFSTPAKLSTTLLISPSLPLVTSSGQLSPMPQSVSSSFPVTAVLSTPQSYSVGSERQELTPSTFSTSFLQTTVSHLPSSSIFQTRLIPSVSVGSISGSPMPSSVHLTILPTPSMVEASTLLKSSQVMPGSSSSSKVVISPSIRISSITNEISPSTTLPLTTVVFSSTPSLPFLPSSTVSLMPRSSLLRSESQFQPTPSPYSQVGIISSSAMITTEPTTQPPVYTTEPQNKPPRLQYPIDEIVIALGDVLYFSIPEETFFDQEDGLTSNLQLDLLITDNDPKPVSKSYWLQLDSTRQILYGAPLANNLTRSRNEFLLSATDSSGLVTYDAFVVVVQNRPSDFSHEFILTLENNFADFIADGRNVVMLCESIANFLGDVDTKAFSIYSVDEGSVVMTYSNKTISRGVCDLQDIDEVLEHLANIVGLPVSPYQNIQIPDFLIINVERVFLNQCAPTTVPILTSGTQLSDNSNFLLATVVPGVVVAVVLLVVSVICCCLYKRKRGGEEFLLRDEKPIYAKNRKPIYLDGELDDKEMNGISNPVVLPVDLEISKASPAMRRTGHVPKKEQPLPPQYRLPDYARINLEMNDVGSGAPRAKPPEYSSNPTLFGDNATNVHIGVPPPLYRLPPPYQSQDTGFFHESDL